MATIKEEEVQAEDCPTGRIEITGVIIKVALKVNQFGERWVMTVKDDGGFLVWGTRPLSIKLAAYGTRVRFTATCEPSDKDKKFGFFKRPANAEIIYPDE